MSYLPALLQMLRRALAAGAAVALIAAPGPVKAVVAGAITVYPQVGSLAIGATQQCTAYVPITPNTITWQVNGIPGGNATVGTITATGLYQAPATVPNPGVVTISAQSTAYPSSIGSSPMTITRKVPALWSVNPSQLQAGNYAVTFNGANYAPDSVASANGADVTTVYVSPTSLIAKGAALRDDQV